MSDKIYVPGGIPSNYKYGQISSNYIDLYPKSFFQNETTDYYRIYYGYSSGLYEHLERSFNGYNPTSYNELPVSYSVFDRPDFISIISITLMLTFCGIWLLNLITSFVRKGGLLGGLF